VLLKALCQQLRLPLWQTIRHLTVCFVRSMPAHERRTVMNRAKAESGNPRTRSVT